MADFETTPAAEPVAIRWKMLSSLTDYYPKNSRNTNFYRFLSAYGDLMTDIDYEVDYTVLDTGVDEARTAALLPNLGHFYTLPIRGDLNWGWDDYRFMLKVLGEAWTIYGSTAFGMRRVTQVATGVSPILREHFRYTGWILDQFALGATAIVESGDYIWNTVSSPLVSAYNFYGIWPQQQTHVWVCGDDGAGTGQIWRSENAGYTWRDTNPPAAITYYDVHGISHFETWACGEVIISGALTGIVSHWHYADGWDRTSVISGASLRGIWMRTPNDGWVVGTLSNLHHWDGTTWTVTAVPGPAASFFAIHGIQSGYAYAVGANNKVIRYNPTTTTWTDVSVPGGPYDFRSVWVVDANTAFVCGLNGVVCWTTNGGAAWTVIIRPPAWNLYGIWASSDAQTVRIVGRNGALHYSTNGGTIWTTETYQGSGTDLNDIYIRPNETMGYICGDLGILLRRNGQSPGFTLPTGTFIANGELINGAILESRHGRRNSVDVIVWNVMDYSLLWRFLNEMKPAHVKLFIMFEYPFVMDYYYYDYDFYTGVRERQLLEDIGARGLLVNGRPYGESMARVVVGEVELYIPQLS